MADNNFILDLIGGLHKGKSRKQIKEDAKKLGDIQVGLIGKLRIAATRKAIQQQLKDTGIDVNITPKVNSKGIQSATQHAVKSAQKTANKNKVQLNFDIDKRNLVDQIRILARENNKLFKSQEMTNKYNELLSSASLAKNNTELKSLRKQLSQFKTELVATNNAGLTWGEKFKASIKRYAQFFSGASVIYTITDQIRNAATSAKSLDDRLVDLHKVTSEIEDRDALYKYFDRSMKRAKELNVKIDNLLYAVTEFKKLGWLLSDAELGGEWANILSNVADMDIDTAIGSIKVAIASFDEIGGYGNDQMNKKLEAYVDLINAMSNKYSIDAQGLAEAVRLSAGTLTEAHTSIEQAVALFATANKYYNSPDYLGNTVKVGSLRLRASSADTDAVSELEDMGESVDDLVESTSTLREKLLALTGVDIMQDDNTFKSYYQQLFEISQVLDSLSDTSRAGVLETLFGKNRSAAGAAILSGMKESVGAYETAINSAGSATEEYNTWLQSADAATQRFSNSLIESYQKIVSGNIVRDVANFGAEVLDLANAWGILEGTLKGVVVLGVGKFLSTGAMAMVNATKQVEQYGKALQIVNNMPTSNPLDRLKAINNIAHATQNLTGIQLKHVLSNKALTQQDRVRILQAQGMTRQMAVQRLEEMKLTTATKAQTAANTASTASTFNLKSAMVGLGATMKNLFLSNPVGIVLMGISVGVSAVTSAVSNHNQKMDELKEKTKEAADTANELGDEITELAMKYISLTEAVETDESAKEDLISTQTELLKKLELEGENIDTLIDKYGSLSNAIKQASIDALKESQIDLIANVDLSKGDLIKAGKSTKSLISYGGEDSVRAYNELAKAGLISSSSYGSGGGAFALIGDNKTIDGVLENYNRLKDALEALRDSNAFTQEELSNNPVWKALYAEYTDIKDEAEAYQSAVDNLNENLAHQIMLTSLQTRELPKTEAEFKEFKNELIDTAIATGQLIGTEEEVVNAISGYLSTVPEFSEFFSIPLQTELEKVDDMLGKKPEIKRFSLNETQSEIVDEYKELIANVSKVYEDYENLTPPDVVKLFEDTGYDFTNYLEGAESLEGALRSLVFNGFEKVKDAVVDMEGAEEYLNYLEAESRGLMADAFGWTENVGHVKTLETLLEEIRKGKPLERQLIDEISKAYGLNIQQLEDGFTFDEDAVQELLDKFIQEYNESLAGFSKFMREVKGFSEEGILNFFGTYTYRPISSDSKTSSSSSTPFSEQIDWAAQSISVLEDKVKDADTTLSQTKGYAEQIQAIESVIEAQKGLQNGYEKSAELYEGLYNNSLNSGILAEQGLSDLVRSQIESGDVFSIEDFIDTNVASGEEGLRERIYNAINEAIGHYNNSNEARDNAVQIGIDIDEKEIEKLETVKQEYTNIREIHELELESAQTVEDKLKILDRIKGTLKLEYKVEQQIAEENGNIAALAKSQLEEKQAILDVDRQSLDILQEYVDTMRDIAETKLESPLNDDEMKNQFKVTRQAIINSYAPQIATAELDGDTNKAYLLKLQMEQELIDLYEQELELKREIYDFEVEQNEYILDRLDKQVELNGGDATAEQLKEQYNVANDAYNDLMTKYNKEVQLLAEIEAANGQNSSEYREQLTLVQAIALALEDWLIKIRGYGSELLSIPLDKLDEGIENLEAQAESARAAVDGINDTLENMDTIISGAQSYIQDQIDAQEELKKPVQEQLDALKEQRDMEEDLISLEKARYELERARNQRTVKLYAGEDKGFIYTQDHDALRDAQENMDNLEYEEAVRLLEEQLEQYDKIIENLQEIKDAWGEVAQNAQDALDIQTAIAALGTEGIMDMSNVTSYTEQYTGLLKSRDAAESTVSAIEAGIDAMEELKEKLQKVVEQYNKGLIDAGTASEQMRSLLWDNADLLQSAFPEESISAFIQGWIDDVKEINKIPETFDDIFGRIKVKIDEFASMDYSNLEQTTQDVKKIIEDFFNTKYNKYGFDFADAITDLSAIESFLKEFALYGWDSSTYGTDSMYSEMFADVTKLNPAFGEMADSAKEASLNIIDSTDNMANDLGKTEEKITEDVGVTTASILEKVNELTNLLSSALGVSTSKTEGAVKESGNTVVGQVENTGNKIEGVIDNTVDNVSEKIAQATTTHADLTQDYADTLKTIIDKLCQDLSDSVKDTFVSISDVLGVQTVDISAKLTSIVSNAVSDIEKLKKFADGTLSEMGISNGLSGNTSVFGTGGKTADVTFANSKIPLYHDGLENGFVGEKESNDRFKALGLRKLKPDEIPAVLKINEAVLNQFQQRNILDNVTSAYQAGLSNVPVMNRNAQVNVGNIQITCPGVTSQQVMQQISEKFQKEFGNMNLDTLQMMGRRR